MGRCEVWSCYGKALPIMNFKIIIESVIAGVILGLVPEAWPEKQEESRYDHRRSPVGRASSV